MYELRYYEKESTQHDHIAYQDHRKYLPFSFQYYTLMFSFTWIAVLTKFEFSLTNYYRRAAILRN